MSLGSVSIEDWDEYYAVSLTKPIHPLFGSLEPYLQPEGGNALDLGCGVGNGSLWLRERGYTVRAVDASPRAVEILRSRASDPKLTSEARSFQSLELAQYDLIVASFSLFFLEPEEFRAFWYRVAEAVRPGGLFMGQFLGVNDEWTARNYAVVDRVGALELLQDFELLHFDEVEQDGTTAVGTPKHWHIFYIIGRRH